MFSQNVVNLVSFKQITQDKNARICYQREGGAKQRPTNLWFVDAGHLSQNDGNHENDEDNSDS